MFSTLAEHRGLRVSSGHKLDINIMFPPLKTQGPLRKMGWQEWKNQGSGNTSEEQRLLDMPGLLNEDSVVAVVAYTRSAQDRASQHSSLEEEGLTGPYLQCENR